MFNSIIGMADGELVIVTLFDKVGFDIFESLSGGH